MKTIRETERTLTLTDEKGSYKIISPDYSETYGSLSLQDGCQIEDLLAICIHRLEQDTESASSYPEDMINALNDMQNARACLKTYRNDELRRLINDERKSRPTKRNRHKTRTN